METEILTKFKYQMPETEYSNDFLKVSKLLQPNMPIQICRFCQCINSFFQLSFQDIGRIVCVAASFHRELSSSGGT